MRNNPPRPSLKHLATAVVTAIMMAILPILYLRISASPPEVRVWGGLAAKSLTGEAVITKREGDGSALVTLNKNTDPTGGLSATTKEGKHVYFDRTQLSPPEPETKTPDTRSCSIALAKPEALASILPATATPVPPAATTPAKPPVAPTVAAVLPPSDPARTPATVIPIALIATPPAGPAPGQWPPETASPQAPVQTITQETQVLPHNLVAPALAAVTPPPPSAAQEAIVDDGLKMIEAVERTATADQNLVDESFQQIPRAQVQSSLMHAQAKAREIATALTEAVQSPLAAAERLRFSNLYFNAADKAGFEAHLEEARNQTGLTPLGGFTPLGVLNPNRTLAGAPLLSQKQDSAPKGSPQSNSALVDRIKMYLALPPEKQKLLSQELGLLEPTPITLKSGQAQHVDLLHNGYLLSGLKTGYDCSSFVSSILPPDLRRTSFTSLDFRNMWIYLIYGKIPNPPTYEKGRKAIVQKAAEAFTPVDVYAGESLQKGDILVSRLIWDTTGHVFLVKKYDETTLDTRVLEAAQSAGTLRERGFPLSVDPVGSPRRIIRPGLFALRLKTDESQRTCRKPATRGSR